MEYSLDDLVVKIPSWISEMFQNSVTGSKLTQLYTTLMGLHQLQQKNVLCDVNIKVEDTVFHAHKAVLAAASKFFRNMFTSGFQESHEPDVSITGKPEAFKIILEFIYTCELTLSFETVFAVLEMSHYLQLDLVLKKCEQFLINKLNDDVGFDAKAVITSLTTAKVYGLELLIQAAKRCIAQNFDPSQKFLELMTVELLEEILSGKDLKGEKQVYSTTLAWLQHDWEERKQFAPTLLRKVRLGVVPLSHLSKTFLVYPELYAIKECKELIHRTLDMIDAHKAEDAPLHFTEPSLFAKRSVVDAILGIGMECGYYYDIDTHRWITLTKFPPLPEKDGNTSFGDSCVSTNGHLYVSRGASQIPRKLKHPRFLRLDMPKNRWVALEPMNKRRRNTHLVASSRMIYAIGGDIDCDGRNFSCEVYDIDSNTWKSLPSLNFGNGPGKTKIESCKIYQDKLLVYGRRIMEREEGGTIEEHCLKMYDPDVNSGVWTILSIKDSRLENVPSEKVNVGLVVNDNKCYRIFYNPSNTHMLVKGNVVHELIINFQDKTVLTAKLQAQDMISGENVPGYKRTKAFRINEDVYMIFNKQFFKTGIKIPRYRMDPINLESWRNLKTYPSQLTSVLLTQFMFDKEKWQ